MTKKELFEKYNINESHSEWNQLIDNRMSIELYRFMHNGDLPNENDDSVKWITDFLDKKNDINWWIINVMSRQNWGSMYLTAKRLVYSLSDQIIADN